MRELQEVWAELARIAEEGTLVVVEGKRDAAALAAFGIRNVYTLSKPLGLAIEEIARSKRCILLTDLDRHGRALAARLQAGLTAAGCKVERRLRQLLYRTGLRQIEGLKVPQCL